MTSDLLVFCTFVGIFTLIAIVAGLLFALYTYLIESYLKKEREACAQIAESNHQPVEIAQKIRARNKT